MTGIENGSDVVLDGNAAAGLLQEIFVSDITSARIQCAACGSVAAVGALRLYAVQMGAVLRCRPRRPTPTKLGHSGQIPQ